MTNEKPTFEQLCDPAYRRRELVSEKCGAVWTAFLELKGTINSAAIARDYFERTPSWFTQRVNNNVVMGKRVAFKEEEYHQLAEAFRDVARRLNAHADEIDNAAMEER